MQFPYLWLLLDDTGSCAATRENDGTIGSRPPRCPLTCWNWLQKMTGDEWNCILLQKRVLLMQEWRESQSDPQHNLNSPLYGVDPMMWTQWDRPDAHYEQLSILVLPQHPLSYWNSKALVDLNKSLRVFPAVWYSATRISIPAKHHSFPNPDVWGNP